MALTLEKLQKLKNAGLVAYFEADPDPWVNMARRTYQFLKGEFPDNANPLPDDLAPIIIKVLRVHPVLLAKLDGDGLKQQYWFEYFTDLILQQKWNQIQGANVNAR